MGSCDARRALGWGPPGTEHMERWVWSTVRLIISIEGRWNTDRKQQSSCRTLEERFWEEGGWAKGMMHDESRSNEAEYQHRDVIENG